MYFDVSRADQYQTFDRHFKRAYFRKMNELARKTIWIRPFGCLIGAVSGILKVIKCIALIVENVIKGIANVFGSFFFESCKLQRGLWQLLSGIKNVFFSPIMVVSAIISIAFHTFGILSSPVNFTKFCQDHYDLTSDEIDYNVYSTIQGIKPKQLRDIIERKQASNQDTEDLELYRNIQSFNTKQKISYAHKENKVYNFII